MDKQARKQMLTDYRLRKPPMGIVRVLCTATGDVFFGAAKDTGALINGLGTKLDGNTHPNKRLQALWTEHGAAAFDLSVAELLEYEDPTGDYADDLELMLEELLETTPGSARIWK